jgi:hypothetical protein
MAADVAMRAGVEVILPGDYFLKNFESGHRSRRPAPWLLADPAIAGADADHAMREWRMAGPRVGQLLLHRDEIIRQQRHSLRNERSGTIRCIQRGGSLLLTECAVINVRHLLTLLSFEFSRRRENLSPGGSGQPS